MLQTVFSQGLTRCALHFHHHSHLIRLSSITVRKDMFWHASSSRATSRKCFCGKTYSAGNGRNDGGEYKSNPWHKKTLGTLLGALGTVAVFGLGTVFSKSHEEKRGCVYDADHAPLIASEKNEEGEDVVGLEKKHKDEEAIITSDTRPHAESSEGWGVKQMENLSEHEECVRKARKILRRHMEEVGAPGMVVGVTVNGKHVWADGFGFADLEKGVRCSPATVMRIASISKALTMTAVAKLWEDEKLDLDAPVQKYVPNFPIKTYNGEEVPITTRQLISHRSGIRHYKLKNTEADEKRKDNSQISGDSKVQSQTANQKGNDTATTRREKLKDKENITTEGETDVKKERHILTPISGNENITSNKIIKQEKSKDENMKCTCSKHVPRRRKNKKEEEEEEDEFDLKEYYIKEEYETIQDALELFQNDELFFKPGEGYLYTTHGWTVVSAVVEGAAQKPFPEVVKRLFYELGLDNTYLDKPSPIIYNRASYYIRDKHGRLKNAPYVDNSYKWAGGGFLSTVGDLCKFGNAMLYASQQEYREDARDAPKLPGYLKASTIQQLWTPVDGTKKSWRDQAYGMGWEAIPDKHLYEFCRKSRHHTYHTGAAVGASSILLILPQKSSAQKSSSAIPQGVVVALLTNMQGVGLHKVAQEIAEIFEESANNSL